MLMQIFGGKMQSFLAGKLRRCSSLASRLRRCSYLCLISRSLMLVLKIRLLKNAMYILYFALSFCLCKEIEMLMPILGGKMQ